ncbi:dnaJ protein ERDJ3A [Ricinus communis]|uniref:dnaJ protein ERDJ3A n=1 Tax=Ricinus communis TaxID=3988 RepID=UPI00201A262E|nr:dnaJ protein ERDJ3A [Ricinus communis]
MNPRFTLSVILVLLCLSLVLLTDEAKTIDPYKVLGVEKNASQREIQKAFHKLSLQYHPDKNKNKGAQEKFAEINNAYEILSDEEKRKNFDLYGDEKGNPGFDAGYTGNQGGYTYYTSGGQGQNGFNFRRNEWQNMGGQGGSKSFSFSFGGPSSQSSFGFGLNDIFSNLFGGDVGGGHFGGSGGSARSRSSSQSGSGSSFKSIRNINSKMFKKEIADQGMTWLLLSYNPSLRGSHYHESIIQEVLDSLQGALKVGSINCETEKSLCTELGIHPRQMPRVFVYSYRASDKGSLVEYKDDLVARSLKTFCRDHLPRFSRRIDLKQLESFSGIREPRVLLLSTKKDTPVIWRVLSGLYQKRFIFNDIEVHDVTEPMAKKLGVDALPAIVGWLSNGERHVLKVGISVKDLQSAVHDLSAILDDFDKKNKKEASRQGRKQDDVIEKQVPLLTRDNFEALCGEKTPVCIIGAFRSLKAREKLESILTMVSQKPLSRQRNAALGSKDSISYSLLDANRQQAFLNGFEKSGFKSSDKLLLAYKPRKGKFATFEGEMIAENVEGFISSVFNGDVQFTETRQKPVVK